MKNKEEQQARNFQAKHKARKQINFKVAQLASEGETYWNKFYNPFNEFLLMCNKRELAFIYDKAVSDPDSVNNICKSGTRNEIGGWINMKLSFKGNSHPAQQSWFRTLETKCYLVCENGQDVKI